MKDELGAKNMTKFVRIRANIYTYLIYGSNEDEKATGTKNVSLKENKNLEIIRTV